MTKPTDGAATKPIVRVFSWNSNGNEYTTNSEEAPFQHQITDNDDGMNKTLEHLGFDTVHNIGMYGVYAIRTLEVLQSMEKQNRELKAKYAKAQEQSRKLIDRNQNLSLAVHRHRNVHLHNSFLVNRIKRGLEQTPVSYLDTIKLNCLAAFRNNGRIPIPNRTPGRTVQDITEQSPATNTLSSSDTDTDEDIPTTQPNEQRYVINRSHPIWDLLKQDDISTPPPKKRHRSNVKPLPVIELTEIRGSVYYKTKGNTASNPIVLGDDDEESTSSETLTDLSNNL